MPLVGRGTGDRLGLLPAVSSLYYLCPLSPFLLTPALNLDYRARVQSPLLPKVPFPRPATTWGLLTVNISDWVWPQGSGSQSKVRKPYSSHPHVAVMLIVVPRLLEQKGAIVPAQVASQTNQHLRREAEHKDERPRREDSITSTLPSQLHPDLGIPDSCPQEEPPTWHFLRQLLHSKDSLVYRAHGLKQILSCVKAKSLGTVKTEYLRRK